MNIMERVLGGVVLAAGLSVSGAGAGAAFADDVVVGVNGIPIPYSTEKACIADGPDTHLDINDAAYPYWYCQQGEGGAWYLHNTDNPN